MKRPKLIEATRDGSIVHSFGKFNYKKGDYIKIKVLDVKK